MAVRHLSGAVPAPSAGLPARFTSPNYRWFATATVILGMMASVLSSTMVNIAIPNIMGAYGIGQDQAHWMSTAFLAAMPVSMLMNGWLVKRFGTRSTYIAACAIFAVAAGVGQFIPSYYGLVAVRTVQGACAGLLQPLTMTVILPLFPVEERGRAMGIYGMGFIVGPAIGPTIGGVLVDYWHWRDVFGFSIPLMLVALMMGARYLKGPESRGPRVRLNLVSLTFAAAAIGCFLTAISNGQRLGWTSPFIFGLLFASASTFVAFVVTELVTRHPLLEVRLFAYRQFSISMVVAFMFGVGMFGSTYLIPLFAQTVLGYTAVKAGFLLLFTGLIMVPVFPIGGRLARTQRSGLPIAAGMLLFGFSTLYLAGADLNSAFWFVTACAALGRVGLGIALPALQTGSVRELPNEMLAYGAGTLNFVRMTGAAVGTSVLAITLQSRIAFHADRFAATQTPDNPITTELLAKVQALLLDQGVGTVEQGVISLDFLGRLIASQANGLAFQDGFMLLALGFFIAAASAMALTGAPRTAAVAAATPSGSPPGPRPESGSREVRNMLV